MTDGDCGLDAFITGAFAAVKSKKHALQSLAHMSKPDRHAATRKAACKYILGHVQQELWEGFTLGDLVRAGSGMPVQLYLERMRRKGAWVDVPFMHSLACAFRLDVLIMQDLRDANFALLGFSLTPGDKAEAPQWTIPVALVNDFHYWALVPDTEPACVIGSTQESANSGLKADELDEEDAIIEREVDCTGRFSDGRVSAELNLAQRLQLWNPWECPTAELNAVTCLPKDSCVTDL